MENANIKYDFWLQDIRVIFLKMLITAREASKPFSEVHSIYSFIKGTLKAWTITTHQYQKTFWQHH